MKSAKRLLRAFGALTRSAVFFAAPKLSGAVTKRIRAHYRNTHELQLLKYRTGRAVLSGLARAPVKSMLAIAATYAISLVGSFFAFNLPFGPREDQLGDDFVGKFLTINATLLGAQATFIGLVFPLIISLVSLLSANRIGFSGRLSVYIKESEAGAVGITSIVFAAAAAVVCSFLTSMPPRLIVTATAINVVWFIANLGALGFFLKRSLDYLRPDRREELVRAYIANCAWRAQLTSIVTRREWIKAVGRSHQNLIDWPRPAGAVVPSITYYALKQGLTDRLDRRIAKARVLHDVRIRVLSAGIDLWAKRTVETVQLPQEAALEFLVSPSQSYVGTVGLVQAVGAQRLGHLDRFLIRNAFVFRSSGRRLFKFAEIVDLIRETTTDLVALVEANRVAEFDNLLDTTRDTLVLVFAIADYSDPDATEEQQRSFGSDLAVELGRPFVDVVEIAARKLDNNDAFSSISLVGPRLLIRVPLGARAPAEHMMLMLHSQMARELIKWSFMKAPAEQQLVSGPGSFVTHIGAVENTYSKAWRDFVGGWEGLLDALTRGEAYSRPVTWDDLRARGKSIIHHLWRSAEIVGEAVASGDRLGAEWSVDILLAWTDKIDIALSGPHDLWRIRPEALTGAIFNHPWATIEALGERIGNEPARSRITYATLENEWTDYTTFLTFMLIRWCDAFGAEGTAAHAAERILHRRPYDPAARRHQDGNRFRTQDILLSILRVSNRSTLVEQTRSNGMEELGHRLVGMGREDRVMGRVYVGSGSRGPEGFRREQALLLAASVTAGAQPIALGQSLNFYLGGFARDDDRLALLNDLEALSRALDRVAEQANAAAIADRLFPERAGDFGDWPQRIERVRALLQACRQIIETRRLEALGAAELNLARLVEIAAAADRTAFSDLTGNFPINRFGDVMSRPGNLPHAELRVGGQPRGAFVNPQLGHDAPDGDYWQSIMNMYAAAIVMSDTFERLNQPRIHVASGDEFWTELKRTAQSVSAAGGTPIMVVGGWGEPEWLADWASEYREVPRPPDMVIGEKQDQPNGYLFSINDIDVFEGNIPTGAASIFAREALTSIEFQSMEGVRTQVRFEPTADNPWEGSIFLRIGRQVFVDAREGWVGRRITFGAVAG